MPRSNRTGSSSFLEKGAEGSRKAARTQLNHIVGYSEMLKQDAIEDGREDLAAVFATIRESAQALKEPLLARLAEGRLSAGEGVPIKADSGAGILDHEIYGILYALIGLIQDVKGKAAAGGNKDLALDAERLLEAGNAILELMASEEDAPAGAADDAGGAAPPRPAPASPRSSSRPRLAPGGSSSSTTTSSTASSSLGTSSARATRSGPRPTAWPPSSSCDRSPSTSPSST
jgi:hypothetical protein